MQGVVSLRIRLYICKIMPKCTQDEGERFGLYSKQTSLLKQYGNVWRVKTVLGSQNYLQEYCSLNGQDQLHVLLFLLSTLSTVHMIIF